MDSHWRSVCKSLSWRLVAALITGSLAWGLTRELKFAALLGLLDTCVKLGVYYTHERAWNRIKFGRQTPPDYII